MPLVTICVSCSGRSLGGDDFCDSCESFLDSLFASPAASKPTRPMAGTEMDEFLAWLGTLPRPQEEQQAAALDLVARQDAALARYETAVAADDRAQALLAETPHEERRHRIARATYAEFLAAYAECNRLGVFANAGSASASYDAHTA